MSTPKWGWLLLFSCIGCTQEAAVLTGRWSGEGARPSPPAVQSQTLTSWDHGSEKIQISNQTINDFPIENTYIKTLTKQGSVAFVAFNLLESVPPKIMAQVKKKDANKIESWIHFKNKNSDFQTWKLEQPPHVVIQIRPKPRAKLVSAMSNHWGTVYEIEFSEDGHLLSQQILGSRLADLTDFFALAFPKGPKKSDLSKVLLSRWNLPEGLANSHVEVASESPLKIVPTPDFEIPPTDERFDQIQAYYFATQFLNWFENKMNIANSFKVSLLSHVGYPDKTNAAFYYKGQVRLGAGDDITFSKIPWDPSIVTHEVAHSIIDRIALLPFQGEGGSINEGFADVFATHFLDSPRLGESAYRLAPFKRTVETPVHLSEKNGGLYHDSAIVSSFFWGLKSALGTDRSLRLAFKTLERLTPGSDFNDFKICLKEQVIQTLTGSDLIKTQNLMNQWGFQ